MPELWSHYAASVALARVRLHAIRLPRGKRLTGSSKMKFDGLVLHGLTVIALYPTIHVRILIGNMILCLGFRALATGILSTQSHPVLVFAGGTAVLLVISFLLLCTTVLMCLLFLFLAVA